MMEQEILYRAMDLQKQSEEAEQNLKLVEEQIGELENFEKGIDFLEKNDDDEMISVVGKGVFVKSKLVEKKLFVDVGAGVVVRKTPQETREIILAQISRFKQARTQILAQLDSLKNEFGGIWGEIEKAQGKE